MAICNQCLYEESHPFGMTFIDGVCLGCITHLEKYELSWEERYYQLKELVSVRGKRSITYDCIIPVTGDAEDYYVTQEVLKLGLNPLIVAVNSYFFNDIGWKNLHTLITHFDVDSWVYNPEINTYKELIKTSLQKYNHMLLPWLQLHTSFPVHVAKEKSIPLIVWGGNQAVEQVGKFSHRDGVEMTSWSRVEHDLFKKDINELIGNGAQINERKLNYYHYPNIDILGKKVAGIYLSNYMPWDPMKQNRSMVEFGFTPEANAYSFDPYERAGSSVYYGIHDLLKHERQGYRKIRDHCSREIRHGRMTKLEGRELEKLFAQVPVNIIPFFNWLGVSESGVQWFVEHKIKNSKKLILKSERPIGFDNKNIDLPDRVKFMLSDSQIPEEKFIHYGKGINI
jgi:N-acetyl sugar amidotransferase